MNIYNMNIPICFVAFILLISSVIMLFLKDENLFFKFMNTLDINQKNLYLKVVKERTHIYLGGKFIGLILAILYLLYTKNYTKNGVCIFVAITFITQLLFYRIYPKSTYMLRHLNKKEQVSAWLDIYLYMKKIWVVSIVLAIIAYFLLGMGISL